MLLWVSSVEANWVVLTWCKSHRFCKENGSRKLKMTSEGNYILGLIYCKGLKGICEAGFWKELRVCLKWWITWEESCLQVLNSEKGFRGVWVTYSAMDWMGIGFLKKDEGPGTCKVVESAIYSLQGNTRILWFACLRPISRLNCFATFVSNKYFQIYFKSVNNYFIIC